ncbi:uncharacterized protein PAC_19012 [Phialocephala subalpina]|uniref:Heterokaryon incompatibility domain-containing protein n=1 Tax=Phialocephala subalpina TaxID=576137 RepID=A0A1L7XVQ6_9HELO|nr:uncharacterized protein PAC_19012 [Phialocephala subalpina]
MTLHPGKGTDPIICHLSTASLDTLPGYHALSYQWSKDKCFADIICGNASLKVTGNLAAALQALRIVESPKVLWVDAVCINQENQIEKSKQISLMRDIYACAKSVFIWLGPSFPGVKTAWKILPYLTFVGVERHPTGKPDTEKMEDILAERMEERPEHGSIIQTGGNLVFMTHDRDPRPLYTTLERHPELDDDAIFKFDDDDAWRAIDTLFGDLYFERSWIIQEVAVAEAAYVVCGPHTMHWDLFRMAYEGRFKLGFQSNNTGLHYSKQTDSRDYIYAALGIVKPQSLCEDIVPDYNKSVEEVFYEAACHIIRQRQDLYLWSNKTLKSRRKKSEMPSWVPEWTMKSCGEAIVFARPEFSTLISPRLVIKDKALFVDGHLLDEIDEVFTIKDNNVFDIVIRLEVWLEKHGKLMFGAYHGDFQETTSQTTPLATDHFREERRRNTSQLFYISRKLPPIFAEVLRGRAVKDNHPLDSRKLNIEALWSTLTALFDRRIKAPQLEWNRLFLAMLYMCPKLASSASDSVQDGLPKGFSSWNRAAVFLEKTNPELWIGIFLGHFERFLKFRDTVIEDRFFVTKKGMFGSAPAETVKKGQVVTVLGGAWVPYLLEKKEDSYKLVSHAYIEGIMDLRKVPTQWEVSRIKIT